MSEVVAWEPTDDQTELQALISFEQNSYLRLIITDVFSPHYRAELRNIYVDPDQRRKGIGVKLLHRGLRELRLLNLSTAVAEVTNGGALQFLVSQCGLDAVGFFTCLPGGVKGEVLSSYQEALQHIETKHVFVEIDLTKQRPKSV